MAPRVAEKIRQCKEAHSTNLDLSGEGLSEIPPAVFQLTNLTGLSLSNNQLSTLPEAITKLTNLQELFSQKSFMELMIETYKRLPLLRRSS